MKIKLNIADIEVNLEDEQETDRTKIIDDAMGCMEVLVQARISLDGKLSAQAERAEDEPGIRPEITEAQVRPEITMSGLYV